MFCNKRFQFGTGVQAILIPTMKPDETIIKVSHEKQGFGCAIIKKNEIKNYIQSNNGFFESINKDYSFPIKVYFDIDGKTPKECNLDIIKPIINKYFNNPKMAISGYESDKKNSYHIVLPELLIKDYNDLLNMKKLVNKMKEENKYFDSAPYNKNCLMKFVNQSKTGGKVQAIIENDNIEDHVITYYISPNAKPFLFEIDYDEDNINIAKLPKVTPELKIELDNKFNNFTPADHDNALKLLNMMPCNEDNNECYKFVNFAYHNGITFDECYKWLKQKDVNCKAWLMKKWNEQKTTTFKFNINWIHKVLSTFYPNIQFKEDIMTNTFLKSFNVSSVKIPVLVKPTYETADIKLNHFTTDHKAAIFNIGMGGGKTTATVDYLKNEKKTFVWLSVRQALAKNTYQRFTDNNMDVFNYLDATNKYNKINGINNAKSLLISTESLHYLDLTDKFDVLVIDEMESLLNCWDSETHKDHLEQNFFTFKQLFMNCKKIILLDAFTTTKTTKFLKSLDINDIITYTCDYKMTERKLIENDSFQAIMDKMIDDINNKRKIFVFYPFKDDANKHHGIKTVECELHRRADRKINVLTYFSSASDKVKKTLSNVKEEWKNADVILTTSSITVGVNYEGMDFHKVYLITSGMCNLARDVAQVSLRIRCPSNPDIEMFFFDKTKQFIYKYNDFYKNKNDVIYNTLIDDIVVEKLSDFIPCFFKYGELSGFNKSGIKNQKFYKAKTEYEIADKNGKNVIKCIMAYDDIDVIDETTCKHIEMEKVWVSNATMEEKFQVRKHYFDRKLKKLSNDERKFIWDNKLEEPLKNLYDPLVKLVEEDNKCAIIELKKDFTISQKTKDYIASTYSKMEYKNESTMVIKLLNNLLTGFNAPHGNLKIDEEIIYLHEIAVKNSKVINQFIEE